VITVVLMEGSKEFFEKLAELIYEKDIIPIEKHISF
jgi:hypothetical protein